MSFENLGLRTELLNAIAEKGYTHSTPIQAKAIPAILEGRDVLGGAQTGTGKTAAFALPILHRLSASNASGRQPRALVLTPTRELAAQVNESFCHYGSLLKLRSTVVFGGVGIQPQINVLRRGVDILVATPGRLLDLAERRAVDFSHIECLVLDEADRMLDMGFIHDIRRILKLLPAKRQNLLFSATFSDEIKRLSEGVLTDPISVEVARRNTPIETVGQSAYRIGRTGKRSLLSQLIREGDWKQVLIFTRTKHGANRLATQLARDGIETAAIHGNKTQSAREKALAAFKRRSVKALVATDIAARGLDINDLPHVVNYDLPHVAEDYIHRIGRTGRAGKEGEAISLVSEEEGKLLVGIERLIGKKIEIRKADGNHEQPSRQRTGSAQRGRQANAPKRNAARSNKSRNSRLEGSSEASNAPYSNRSDTTDRPKRTRRRSRSGNRQRSEPQEAKAPQGAMSGLKRFFGMRSKATATR